MASPKSPNFDQEYAGQNGSVDVQVGDTETIVSKIADIYYQGFMTDVCLLVNGKEYPSHRLILCASSSVFHVMLMSPLWSDSSESRFFLQETPACAAIFEEFLKYLYLAKIRINQSNAIAILMLADKYDVKDLMALCIDYMCKHVAHACVNKQLVAWMQYTVTCGHNEIADVCRTFVKLNIELVASNDDFGNFEPDIFVSLLQQNDLVLVDEMKLYNIAVEWLSLQKNRLMESASLNNSSPEENMAAIATHMEQLTVVVMSNIRFPMMSPRQLAELLLADLVNQYKEFFLEQMAIGMAYHSGDSSVHRIEAALATPNGRLLFTPRLYTADTYSTVITIDRIYDVPPFHVQTLVFSSLVATNNGNVTKKPHLKPNQYVEWIVDVYPKGVWFRKFWLIDWQGTVEVPEHIARTVRLSLSCKDCARVRVKVGVLVIGISDDIEHVAHVFEKSHCFDESNQILNFDDIVDFDVLNSTDHKERYSYLSPTRCVSQPANLSFASPHVKPTSIKKSALIDLQPNLKVSIPAIQPVVQTLLPVSNSEGYSICRERGLRTNQADKSSAMFTLAPPEWEENFQDLSGWCAPLPLSARHDLAHPYVAPTDELNTPIIALETKGFDFNSNLARREPKFAIDSNQWDVPPSEEREPSSYSAGLVPDNVVDSYSPSIISPGSISSNTIMAWDDGDFGLHERNANVFISAEHQDDFMKSKCSAPLAVVEKKIGEDDFNSGLITIGNEIHTPDIVRMIIDFPVRNEKSMELSQISLENMPSSTCEGLETPVDELLFSQIEGAFDLVSYVDDSPKVFPATIPSDQSTESHGHQEQVPGIAKLRTGNKVIDTQSNEYVVVKSVPQSSKITPAASRKDVVIKEELSSEEEVDEEDETYKPYTQPKSRKRGRKAVKKELEFVLPTKRSRRSTSTCSEMTTASTSSDSKYRELRDRNNEASKRSRQSRKMRDGEMSIECSRMEKENSALKAKADEMERLVKQLRQALLTAVTKKK